MLIIYFIRKFSHHYFRKISIIKYYHFHWRFIPTYVGLTDVAEFIRSARFGSSPRMWGLPSLPLPIILLQRFIPTYVGLTHSIKYRRACLPVHPHVCGAYIHGGGFRSGIVRFIPTYVGLTPSVTMCDHPKTVHPHVCGAYLSRFCRLRIRFGSSPRMWGLHKV